MESAVKAVKIQTETLPQIDTAWPVALMMEIDIVSANFS